MGASMCTSLCINYTYMCRDYPQPALWLIWRDVSARDRGTLTIAIYTIESYWLKHLLTICRIPKQAAVNCKKSYGCEDQLKSNLTNHLSEMVKLIDCHSSTVIKSTTRIRQLTRSPSFSPILSCLLLYFIVSNFDFNASFTTGGLLYLGRKKGFIIVNGNSGFGLINFTLESARSNSHSAKVSNLPGPTNHRNCRLHIHESSSHCLYDRIIVPPTAATLALYASQLSGSVKQVFSSTVDQRTKEKFVSLFLCLFHFVYYYYKNGINIYLVNSKYYIFLQIVF